MSFQQLTYYTTVHQSKVCCCRYYEKVLPPSGNKDVAVLDMCSSWISHYPKGYSAGKITGCVTLDCSDSKGTWHSQNAVLWVAVTQDLASGHSHARAAHLPCNPQRLTCWHAGRA